MQKYTEATYGEAIADQYDALAPALDPSMIERLFELCGQGKVLELGIGTGRVALPLLAKGAQVQGLDASPAMVEKLKAKPHGEKIPVKMGTFAKFQTGEKFDLVFVVFNTFFGLLTQAEQVSCFKSVARALRPGGKFLIEAFVPDLGRFDRGQSLRATGIFDDHVRLDCSLHDPAAQTVESQHIIIGDRGIQRYPVKLRYAWPAELDLMAELAKLKRVERWGGWKKQPFTGSSSSHVSVFQK